MAKNRIQMMQQLQAITDDIQSICRAMQLLSKNFAEAFPSRPPNKGWMLKCLYNSKSKKRDFEPYDLVWIPYWYTQSMKTVAGVERLQTHHFWGKPSKRFPRSFKSRSAETYKKFQAYNELRKELVARRKKLLTTWREVQSKLHDLSQDAAREKTKGLVDKARTFGKESVTKQNQQREIRRSRTKWKIT